MSFTRSVGAIAKRKEGTIDITGWVMLYTLQEKHVNGGKNEVDGLCIVQSTIKRQLVIKVKSQRLTR
jgi:hypothetical protein